MVSSFKLWATTRALAHHLHAEPPDNSDSPSAYRPNHVKVGEKASSPFSVEVLVLCQTAVLERVSV